MILFTGIFIILIIANLPQPGAAALVCSLSLCCRTSHSEMVNGAGPVAALRSAWQSCVYLIDQERRDSTNTDPNHISWTVPQNPWECCSNLTLQVFHKWESEALIKSCVAIWSPVSNASKRTQTYWSPPPLKTRGNVQREYSCSFVAMDYTLAVYRLKFTSSL